MTEFSSTYQPPNAKDNFPSGEVIAQSNKRRKILTDALMLALHREALDAEGKPTKRLTRIAEALAAKAEDGDVVAIREVFDRTEGKVAQPIGGTDDLPPLKGLTVTFVKPE